MRACSNGHEAPARLDEPSAEVDLKKLFAQAKVAATLKHGAVLQSSNTWQQLLVLLDLLAEAPQHAIHDWPPPVRAITLRPS